MENINNEYGQTDPDFIDQNTLVDGNVIQTEDELKKQAPKEERTEFGESDPDYIEQNTPVDHDNYAKDEDPYQYQEEFIEDLKHPENDFESTSTNKLKDEEAKEKIAKNDESANNEDENNKI